MKHCGHTVILPTGSDFDSEIARLAPDCDYGLVIAPDDGDPRKIYGLSGKLLAKVGIDVPAEVPVDYSGKRVIKPVKGAGSVGVRIAKDGELPGTGEMSIKYLEGEHYSVSIVGSRVVGEACGFYSGLSPVFLTINRQFCEVGEDGKFIYKGGETPVHPPREAEMIEVAKKAIETLEGYVGLDMIVGEKIWVVDVDARPFARQRSPANHEPSWYRSCY